MSSEVKGCKKLIDTLKEQVVKMQETQSWLVKELKKETEVQSEKHTMIKSELQKDITQKYKQLDTLVNTHFKSNTSNFSTINDKLKKLANELIELETSRDSSKETKEVLSEQENSITAGFKAADEKFKLLSNEMGGLNLKVAQIEGECIKVARSDEEDLKFARLEEGLAKANRIESALTAIRLL
eukprot:TRINITY_DN22361_c0_g1_i1.p2 TRINITY_DN22361_c0_g1~~TRINITY_DN22361_c0_g1_i1.p2  ORF type:complete len:184 (-),score=44.49 TRINITY_DN22361_c0_g1_i1:236-787(-)